VPLTSAQQGMPPCAADLVAEAVQSQQVRRNCMVREVTIQDPLKPRANEGHGFTRLENTAYEAAVVAVFLKRYL